MIARLLDMMGVDQIEAGIPAMGLEEEETVRRIAKLGLKSSIMAWNRAVIEDLERSIRCGVDAVAVSIAVSDLHIKYKLRSSREEVIDHMVRAVEFAKKEGMYVSVNGEDASRADLEYLVKFAQAAKEAGADRFRFCDTVGVLDPLTTYDTIKKLQERLSMDIEIHAHNDFGMATANTVAAIMGGATHAGVTVTGLGERAGNAALEEVAMALKHALKMDHGLRQEMFKELSEYVSKASGRFLPSWKPVVGDNIFAHESGIHVDGALKHPETYEVFNPAEVGLERKIFIGKHSGTAALVSVLEQDATGTMAYLQLEAMGIDRNLLF